MTLQAFCICIDGMCRGRQPFPNLCTQTWAILLSADEFHLLNSTMYTCLHNSGCLEYSTTDSELFTGQGRSFIIVKSTQESSTPLSRSFIHPNSSSHYFQLWVLALEILKQKGRDASSRLISWVNVLVDIICICWFTCGQPTTCKVSLSCYHCYHRLPELTYTMYTLHYLHIMFKVPNDVHNSNGHRMWIGLWNLQRHASMSTTATIPLNRVRM